jgi:RNA polymerase sigma-70 factor, ECF subfamily
MAEVTGRAAHLQSTTPFRIVRPEGLPISERSDEQLMLDHGDGSEDAFAELLRRHQGGIFNFTFRMVNNRHIAEELTQDVFMALVKNAHRYEPRAKFTTYLYTIASNIVSKEWLRRKRRPLLLSFYAGFGRGRDDEEFDPIEHVGDSKADVLGTFQKGEISDAVNDALNDLPEHQREAFVLRRFRDLPYEEIAEITGSPIGTVKSRVVRAERALRPLLERFREYL